VLLVLVLLTATCRKTPVLSGVAVFARLWNIKRIRHRRLRKNGGIRAYRSSARSGPLFECSGSVTARAWFNLKVCARLNPQIGTSSSAPPCRTQCILAPSSQYSRANTPVPPVPSPDAAEPWENSAIAWSALPRHGALHLDRCSAISRLTTSHFGPASYWCPFAIANLSGVPLLCAERSPRGSPLVDNPLAAWVNGGTVNGLPDCARARCRRF